MTPDENSDERFVALLVSNQQRVFRFLMTLVPNRDDAEDLLQQTCLTLWQSREKFDPKLGEFASWACAIAHNHVRNYRRREKSRRTMLSEEVTQSLISTRAEHNPHFPALRSDPVALSGASRRKQTPSSSIRPVADSKITMLGVQGDLEWKRDDANGLSFHYPSHKARPTNCGYAWAFKIKVR